MANPTTNYGFVLPTPTDLVTDLPADFDVALQGVDTTLKALNPSTTLGDIEYRSATANTNTRLPIGTSGQALIVTAGVPSWGTVGGGSLTLLSTTTLSGTSTTISSINGTYKNLYIEIENMAAGAAFLPKFRLNAASNAHYSINARSSISSNTGRTNDSIIIYDNGYAASGNNLFAMTIFNYAATTTIKSFNYAVGWNDSGTVTGGQGGGMYNSASAITSFAVVSDQTFTGGEVRIYGVN